VEARMPAFASRAELLAQAMAMRHGLPPQTPAEPPIDMEMTKVGQKLVSPDGGLSCISCHGIAKMEATQVFESAGINLSYAGARLQKSYFQRWLRNLLRVDPQTKMPVYFDEDGRSPLTEVLEGDGAKQIESVWQYIRLGSKMEPPGTGQ